MYSIKKISQDCTGGPVVKTLPSNAGGMGSIPGEETKIDPTCLVANKTQNIKQKQYGDKFNKDFKNGPHQKKKNIKKRGPKALNEILKLLNILFA